MGETPLQRRCDSCGSLHTASATFCRSCGASLSTAPNACHNCGSQLLDDSPFCGTCGAGQVGATLPQPDATSSPSHQHAHSPAVHSQTQVDANSGVGQNITIPGALTPAPSRRGWWIAAAAVAVIGGVIGLVVGLHGAGKHGATTAPQSSTTFTSATTEADPATPATDASSGGVAETATTPAEAISTDTTGVAGSGEIRGFSPPRLIGDQNGAQVRTVAISPDGSQVLTAGSDAKADVWSLDSESGVPLDVFSEHTKWVYEAAYNRDGSLVATASDDGTVMVRSSRTHDAPCGRPFVSSDQAIDAVRFFPNRNWIVTGDQDGWVRVWDIDSCSSVTDLWVGLEVFSVDVSADGNLIAAAAGDRSSGVVKMWSVDSAFTEYDLGPIGHAKKVRDVTFAPDGPFLVTTSRDNTAAIWDLRDSSNIATLRHQGYVQEASFSSDGRYLVTTNDRGSPRVWDVSALASGASPVPVAALDNTKVWSAVFVPGTYTIVTGGYDGKILRWDPRP